MKKIFPFFIVLVFWGCGEPKIDASSESKLTSSIEEVKQSLNEEEQTKFEQSLRVIAMQNFELSDLLQLGQNTDDFTTAYLSRIKDDIDGKTASEIISQAEEVRKELEEKQRKQLTEEIQELEEKQKEAELAKEDLSKFEVTRSRFYKKEDLFSDQPVIELTVMNNTEHAVSRAHFKGTYATPGRQVPWLVDDFNYSIPGGLEPGEEQSWSLAPNMFSDWGNLEVRSDAVLTVEVTRLDGPDGEVLFDAEGLSEFEEERLVSLKDQLSELGQ